MTIQKFTTRLDEIEAMEITLANVEEVADWCGGEVMQEAKSSDHTDVYTAVTVPMISGPVDLPVGYYLIKNSRGRFEGMTATAFHQKYEGSLTQVPLPAKMQERVDKIMDPHRAAVNASQEARRTLFGKPSL